MGGKNNQHKKPFAYLFYLATWELEELQEIEQAIAEAEAIAS